MKTKIQDLIITISAFGLIIMLGVSGITIGAKLFTIKNPTTVTGYNYDSLEIVVQPGDTLWSIARNKAPDEDPRDVIGAIRELNDLSSADIFPGQTLTLQIRQPNQPLLLVEQSY